MRMISSSLWTSDVLESRASFSLLFTALAVTLHRLIPAVSHSNSACPLYHLRSTLGALCGVMKMLVAYC